MNLPSSTAGTIDRLATKTIIHWKRDSGMILNAVCKAGKVPTSRIREKRTIKLMLNARFANILIFVKLFGVLQFIA